MDLTNVTLEELEAKLDEVQQNISIEKQRGPEKNEAQIAAWEREEADILAQMDQVSKQVTVQAHEERVQQASDKFADVVDKLDVGEGLILRNYIENESDYQVVSIAIKQAFCAEISPYSEIIKGYEEREIQYQRQNKILQQSLTEAQQNLVQLADEKADLISKLFNAANELDKANAEIESLKAQFAAKSKPAEATPELSPEERARRVLEKKAEITVYNVRPNRPVNPTEFTASLAATNREISYNWTQKNRFIEVDEQTALQFRADYEAANGNQNSAADAQATGQAEPIQTPDIPAVAAVQDEQFRKADAVSEAGTTAEMAQQEVSGVVSREEFQSLEARVTKIESHLYTPEWAK